MPAPNNVISVVFRGYSLVQSDMSNKLEKAYAAGLFDGEGCVFIGLRHRRPRPERRETFVSPQYFVRVSVHMTSLKSVEWLKAKFGGGIYYRKKGKYDKPYYKPSYEWYCQCNVALRFLDQLLPYLVIKKAEADVALLFRKTNGGSPYGKRGNVRMTDSEQNFRAQLNQKLHDLKKVA